MMSSSFSDNFYLKFIDLCAISLSEFRKCSQTHTFPHRIDPTSYLHVSSLCCINKSLTLLRLICLAIDCFPEVNYLLGRTDLYQSFNKSF